MRKASLISMLILGSFIAPGPASADETILENPTFNDLSHQDINATQDLIEALRRAANRGPIFRISPQEISIDMKTGEHRSRSVRITNSGDEAGKILGVNLLGSISGISLENGCGEELRAGDFCELTVDFTAVDAGVISTSIIGTINEMSRSSFEVPVSIRVAAPPKPVEIAPEPAPKPEPKPEDSGKAQARAMPRNVAKSYMALLGRSMNSPRGFMHLRAPVDKAAHDAVAGTVYGDINVRTVHEDARYPEKIASVDASLPVDRDRILTTDRVIKAVLETPVSNVMCSKVVAMVESDVYSATSSKPLIQAGSRVVGECQQFVDERVGIAWNRIITTDGRSISFENRMADTRDASGLGGALGRVYMSPFDRYVLPIFSTMIDTVAGLVYANNGTDQKVVVDQYGNATTESSAKNEGLRLVTDQARGTAQEIIKDIRDTRKIAIIPKGSRIDIEIMEDIYFRPDRKVVALSDMEFPLENLGALSARRDVPSKLTLVPVDPSYAGASVLIDGRRYRVETDGTSSPKAADIPRTASQQVVDDLSSPNSVPNKE